MQTSLNPQRFTSSFVVLNIFVASPFELPAVLNLLGSYGIKNLLVEAGPGLVGAMIRESLVDEVIMYMAPTYLGDKAMGIFSWAEILHLDQAVKFRITSSEMLGTDLKLVCRFNN